LPRITQLLLNKGYVVHSIERHQDPHERNVRFTVHYSDHRCNQSHSCHSGDDKAQ
jgi:hypothetical protein